MHAPVTATKLTKIYGLIVNSRPEKSVDFIIVVGYLDSVESPATI